MPRLCFRLQFIGAIFGSVVVGIRVTQAAEIFVAGDAVASVPLAVEQPSDSSSLTTERIRNLRSEIARHNTLYFEHAAPEISDSRYDELKRELLRLEQTFPGAAQAAPLLSDVGDDRNPGFTAYQHAAPMLSLGKSYTEAELRDFVARTKQRFPKQETTFIIEPKFDGVAISVTYERGQLVRAVTRGNGIRGDDVTVNALAIRNLPRRLETASAQGARNAIPEIIELRGEIFLPHTEFQRINREQEAAGERPYAHPRNLAAGTLKQHSPHEAADRGLQVVFYGWGAVVPAHAIPPTQREFHELVRAWGLPVVKNVKEAGNANGVWAAVRAFGTDRTRLEFPIDGVVVKLNSVAQQDELGANRSAPHWATAYKFAPEQVETMLRGITFQVGRTGALTPVAELVPVQLAGSTIRRASLSTAGEITRRDLRVGDTVILEKAGEIIPMIVGVNLTRRNATSAPFVIPTACPGCGTQVETGDASPLRCPNRECPAQVQRRLEHFGSKAAMDISGLGPAMIETLVAKDWVKEIPDLYRLRRDQLITLGRRVGTSSDRLVMAIEASKRAELWRVIHGVGIPRVGPSSAKALAQHFGTLQALATARPQSLEIQRSALETLVGKATTDAVIAYLGTSKNQAMIEQLISVGLEPSP